MQMRRIAIALMVAGMVAASLGQTTKPAAKQPVEPPATQPAAVHDGKEVAAYVDGMPVYEDQIMQWFAPRLLAQGINQEQLEQLRPQFRTRGLEEVIDFRLLAVEAEREGINLTSDQITKMMREDMEAYIRSRGISLKEFDERTQQRMGISGDEYVQLRLGDPSARAKLMYTLLAKKKFGDGVKVTDEDVAAAYKEQVKRRYFKPAEVRASHILFGKVGMTPEETEMARVEAERVYKHMKETNASFEDMARQYSADTSTRERGGDIGYFKLQGRIDRTLAQVAFNLKAGEVSEVFKTQFGWHIVKTTDHKAEVTTSLEEAKEELRRELEYDKPLNLIADLTKELRAKATITYPPGKEPQPVRPPMIRTMGGNQPPDKAKPAKSKPKPAPNQAPIPVPTKE